MPPLIVCIDTNEIK
jgi:intraflagellar transport protein 81